MTPAQEILKLIEAVSPDDTTKLDEIDARVWCYLERTMEFIKFGALIEGGNKFLTFRFTDAPTKQLYEELCVSWGLDYQFNRKYTRSRDALKAIRPKGWQIYGAWDHGKWRFVLIKEENNFCSTFQPKTKDIYLPTEELAELHAIIQAIEWERTNVK